MMRNSTTETKKDEIITAADTYSQSSHEEEDGVLVEREFKEQTYHDDEYDMDESDDDDEEDSSVLGFLREHWLAMVVAFVAACLGHWYTNNHTSVRLHNVSKQQHSHVISFQRMTNISFCPPVPTDLASNGGNGQLKLMDFFLPQSQFETIQQLYQADGMKDDTYSIGSDSQHLPDLAIVEDWRCLTRQRSHHDLPDTTHIKLKGTTYYYQNPSLEDIYPDWEEEDTATSTGDRGAGILQSRLSQASRQRKLHQPPPLSFTGFGCKFVNLSPNAVLLFWDGKGGHDDAKRLVGEIAPFESLGTATMPGHSFHVTNVYDSNFVLQRWAVTADTALIHYEPHSEQEMGAMLSDDHLQKEAWMKYQFQLLNQAFARDYIISSKRTWLSNFPRQFPQHHMHLASYMGQVHQVGRFTLTVASVMPRVLVIDNFLSEEDCQQVIALSQSEGLRHSTLHQGATAQQTLDLSTRRSTNAWLPRETSSLTESIYEKAAEVTQIDPELFQKFHESSALHHSIAESLQVVRYKKGGEEYRPHHDSVFPSINNRHQSSRFATLLLYLNDVEGGGGETRFPKAVINNNERGLEIKPKAGQAVLFYNLLEDGNVDDLSLHGSNPTVDQEKWMANLWIWDPIID